MNRQQVLVGGLVVVLCSALLSRQRWFLENTANGKRLTRWFGSGVDIWVLRGLIAAGIIFGCLLAADVIRPIKW